MHDLFYLKVEGKLVILDLYQYLSIRKKKVVLNIPLTFHEIFLA